MLIERKYFFTLRIGLLFLFVFVGVKSIAQKEVFNLDSLVQLLDVQQGKERIATLAGLSSNSARNNPQISIDYATEGLILARQIKDELREADFLFDLGIANFTKGEFELVLEYIQEAQIIYKRLEAVPKLATCWRILGINYRSQREFEQAHIYLNKSLTIFESLEQYKEIAIINTDIGGCFYWQRKYKKALFYYDKAIAICEEKGLNKTELIASSNKATILSRYGKPTEAIDIHFKTLSVYHDLKEYRTVALTFHNIGYILKEHQLYEEAINYYTKALNYYNKLEAKNNLSLININLGEIAFLKKDYPEALRCYERAMEIDEEINFGPRVDLLVFMADLHLGKEAFEVAEPLAQQALDICNKEDNLLDQVQVYRILGNVYLKRNELNKAAINLKKAISIVDSLKIPGACRNLYKDLSSLYQQKGNYQQALVYQNKHQIITDSLFNISKIQEINKRLIVEKLATQKAKATSWQSVAHDSQKEISSLQAIQNQSQRKQSFLLAGLLGLLMILSIWAYIYKQKQKEITNQLEKRDVSQTKLKEELKSRNQEISDLSINLVRKNQALKDLKLSFEKLAKSPPTQKELNDLLRRMQLDEMIQEDWNYFQELFNKIFPNFFSRLRETYPNLSKKDLRLCGLIRSNISSQEIGDIIGISLESVHSARYRLRKKMNLERKVDLNAFLKTL